ncbi:hypothetical protein FAGKG844_360003 [Frankia sp. AgKG'84/4]
MIGAIERSSPRARPAERGVDGGPVRSLAGDADRKIVVRSGTTAG